MHCGTIFRGFGSTQMTCVYSFPNSKRNRSDTEESDPIDCCVLSIHTPSSLLVYRKNSVITSFSFLLPDLLHFSLSRWISNQILLGLVIY